MTKFNWKRINNGSKNSPLYVYDCEDYKIARDYDSFNPTELGMEIQVNMFRVVHNSDGWEVLRWQWSNIYGAMRYVRFGSSWGWKTKKDAIEDAEYEINRLIERNTI